VFIDYKRPSANKVNYGSTLIGRVVIARLRPCKIGSQWILEADIKGFFNNINFKWLLENIPMNKKVLRAWLNCGFIEGGKWFPTTDGVPQGGIISPVIGNRVLDGLEAVICNNPYYK